MPAREQAIAIASNLIEADLRGVASHGVVRFPIYVERLRAGVVNPRPNVRIVRETDNYSRRRRGQWHGTVGCHARYANGDR